MLSWKIAENNYDIISDYFLFLLGNQYLFNDLLTMNLRKVRREKPWEKQSIVYNAIRYNITEHEWICLSFMHESKRWYVPFSPSLQHKVQVFCQHKIIQVLALWIALDL